jgi:hypothetical protein
VGLDDDARGTGTGARRASTTTRGRDESRPYEHRGGVGVDDDARGTGTGARRGVDDDARAR